MVYRKNPASQEELRRLAAARWHGRAPQEKLSPNPPEVQQLLEELEIRQIELELQNDHLNTTRQQLEEALSQVNERYDFAPVGIVSLDQKGVIIRLNLAAATLLGGGRARLLGSWIGLYLTAAGRTVFTDLLKRALVVGEVQDGEFELAGNGPSAVHVQFRIAPLMDIPGCEIILVDDTERKACEQRLRTSEERWQLALDAAGDGVWDWNVLTDEVFFSRRLGLLFGFASKKGECRLEDWMSRIHPDDKARVRAEIQVHLSGRGRRFISEHRMQSLDGHWKWVLVRGAIVCRTAEGHAKRMVGTQVDITGQKKTEEALSRSVGFQQAVFDSLAAQIVVLDRYGVILQANAAWRNYVAGNGFAGEGGAVGMHYLDILETITGNAPQTMAAAAEGVAAVVTGEVSDFQLQPPFFVPLDKRWFSLRVMRLHDVEHQVVVSHEDVSLLKAAELASMELANLDALTGALSRRHFLELAEQELTRSRRYELPLMVLMLDLDQFKCINDQYGHAAGDAVLQKFVQTVKAVLRESDLVGRVGGEEFAVLLPNTALEGGRTLAQRIIEKVHASPLDMTGQCIVYTVSIGAGCLSNETSFAALLGVADVALYRAKSEGRDRIAVGLP